VVFLADGRLLGELQRPTVEQVGELLAGIDDVAEYATRPGD
jgi:hypothetical protein